MGRSILALALLAFSVQVPALGQSPKKLLFLTHAALYKHTSLGPAEKAVTELGKTGGFEVTTVEGYKQDPKQLDFSFLTPEYLNQFDGVMMMTNGNLPFTDAQKKTLVDFVRGGKALIGAHCASLTFYNCPEFGEMLGGYFNRNLPQGTIAVLKVEDGKHPATKMLGTSWPLVDEFYLFGTAPWDAARPDENIDVLFKNKIPMGFSRDKVHVLLSLDTEHMDMSKQPNLQRGGELSAGVDERGRQGPHLLHVARTSRRHLEQRRRVPRAHQWRYPVGIRTGAIVLALAMFGQPAPGSRLPAPAFHHLHLNSINPDAAIEFYAKAFPSTSKGTFAGQPALRSPNNVWVLFNKVAAPPATQPVTAFWHFGWHVTDVRAALDRYLKSNTPLLPLYTGLSPDALAKGEEGTRTVFVSSDTYPGSGGVLGLTMAGIADAKAKGIKPAGGAGFAYLRGPDDAIVEYQGNMPAERFNHIHMYQDQPFCAQAWYQAHLNVAVRPAAASAQASAGQARTEANCRVERGPDKTLPALDWDGMFRTPAVQTTMFGDVSLYFYMNQGSTPAGPTRGHLMDHYAVSVADLDAWLAKLKAENVTILEPPYTFGGLRAFMIEGPSKEAIEIIEVK